MEIPIKHSSLYHKIGHFVSIKLLRAKLPLKEDYELGILNISPFLFALMKGQSSKHQGRVV